MSRSTGVWTRDEHDQFLEAIKMYPQGPWRKIAECVPTRSLRQVQTHAQKYHEKVVRRMRGLRKDRRNAVERGEHRIDAATLEVCRLGEGFGVVCPGRVQPQLSLLTAQPSQQAEPLAGASIAACAGTAIGGIDTAFFVAESRSRQTPSELPSLDESLDFLIEHLAFEAFSSSSSNSSSSGDDDDDDDSLDFDLGDDDRGSDVDIVGISEDVFH